MPKKKNIEPESIDMVAKNLISALPLLRKRLLHMDCIQAEHGIPLSHVQVLAMLSTSPSLSVSEISHQLGIAKPNITPLVDRLIELELVDRQRDENDRRVVNVVLLEKGEEKLNEICQTLSVQIYQDSQKLTASEFRDLADSLARITRILSIL